MRGRAADERIRPAREPWREVEVAARLSSREQFHSDEPVLGTRLQRMAPDELRDAGVEIVRIVSRVLRIAIAKRVEVHAPVPLDVERGELVVGDRVREVRREAQRCRIERVWHVVIHELREAVSESVHSRAARNEHVVQRQDVNRAEQKPLGRIGRVVAEVLAIEARFRLLGVVPGIHARQRELVVEAVVHLGGELVGPILQLGDRRQVVPGARSWKVLRSRCGHRVDHSRRDDVALKRIADELAGVARVGRVVRGLKMVTPLCEKSPRTSRSVGRKRTVLRDVFVL